MWNWCINFKIPNNIKILTVFLVTVLTSNTHSYSTVMDMVPQIKYILMFGGWLQPIKDFMSGRQAFIKYNCPVKNCYATDDINYFRGNISEFDVIIVNGRIVHNFTYPFERYAHQIFVYANMESSIRSPICRQDFDGFFNWTATYKLNSDIHFKYFTVLDMSGKPVGPKVDMHWIKKMEKVNDAFAESLKSKSRAAAWFVSNCDARERNNFYLTLRTTLKKYNLTIDLYGACGNRRCPKGRWCDLMLQKKYYFYLALENSLSEDYVTEKVLHALHNNVVPIVFGGANYSRFLPCGSYINGRDFRLHELAEIINILINSPSLYRQYFKWKNHYRFESTMPGDIHYHRKKVHYGHGEDLACTVCKTLSDSQKMRQETIYHNIRTWWNPNYENDCKLMRK